MTSNDDPPGTYLLATLPAGTLVMGVAIFVTDNFSTDDETFVNCIVTLGNITLGVFDIYSANPSVAPTLRAVDNYAGVDAAAEKANRFHIGYAVSQSDLSASISADGSVPVVGSADIYVLIVAPA